MRGQWDMTVLKGLVLGVLLGYAILAPAQRTQRTQPAEQAEARLDLNQASLEDLLKIPGMTRTWAGRILRFRPYRTKLDLLDKGIVSAPVYNRIKDYVIVHREKQ